MWGPASGALATTLDHPAFGEWHCGVIEAGIENVWAALQRVRWSDLRLTRPLLLARGFGLGPGLDRGCLATFAPVSVVTERRPSSSCFVVVGKPWSPIPQSVHLDTPAEVHAFDQPGWLKYGMDWHLVPLPDGRTFVETITLCQPTDATARRRFAVYWTIIRVGSGLIRREIIAAIARLSR